mmetsp:Transcript_6987/g.13714  ORF Transcript_6987/g.13714 Transcript_6987/m.13714 type:complete len:242 (-) Transcript_6987:2309-3034(-)
MLFQLDDNTRTSARTLSDAHPSLQGPSYPSPQLHASLPSLSSSSAPGPERRPEAFDVVAFGPARAPLPPPTWDRSAAARRTRAPVPVPVPAAFSFPVLLDPLLLSPLPSADLAPAVSFSASFPLSRDLTLSPVCAPSGLLTRRGGDLPDCPEAPEACEWCEWRFKCPPISLMATLAVLSGLLSSLRRFAYKSRTAMSLQVVRGSAARLHPPEGYAERQGGLLLLSFSVSFFGSRTADAASF